MKHVKKIIYCLNTHSMKQKNFFLLQQIKSLLLAGQTFRWIHLKAIRFHFRFPLKQQQKQAKYRVDLI